MIHWPPKFLEALKGLDAARCDAAAHLRTYDEPSAANHLDQLPDLRDDDAVGEWLSTLNYCSRAAARTDNQDTRESVSTLWSAFHRAVEVAIQLHRSES